MTPRNLWILPLFLLLLFSCKSAPVIPDWVANGKAPEQFKPLLYLVGIAEGAGVAAAKDNARAEIAKQFSVKIDQMLQVMEQYTGMESDKGDSWIAQTDIREMTRTYVQETIEGITIAETWFDEQKNRGWAMAVLRRSPALMRLQEQVMELDEEIKRRVEFSSNAGDILQKIRPLVQALELMKERSIKNQQLTVVNYAGVGLDADITAAQLNEALNRTLSGIKLTVTVDGDVENRIRNAIVQSLNNGRISVQPDSENCDILIEGKLNISRTNESGKTPYVFARITTDLSLVSKLDGRIFGQVEHTMRDGALDWKDAKEKTLSKLAKQIVIKFNAKLYEYLSL